jgi:hypothetical protein
MQFAESDGLGERKGHMSNRIRSAFAIACLSGLIAVAFGKAQVPDPKALAKTPNPELIGQLSKDLSITPKQATGGAGAIFGLAKTKLKPDEFSQLSSAVPGMDGLLKAAPKVKGASALGTVAGGVPGGAGGLASLAGSFKALGLSPDMASKFVPVMSKFVEGKGGASAASLLTGALK